MNGDLYKALKTYTACDFSSPYGNVNYFEAIKFGSIYKKLQLRHAKGIDDQMQLGSASEQIS